MDPVLRVERLTRSYGTTRGVGPISLSLDAGIHGLVGPNGSGKTTLIKTCLGFLSPTGGNATVLGHDSMRETAEVRRRVGYMAENDVFVPGLNATQTVRLAAELCGLTQSQAHEAASEALYAVGLGEEALHSPNRLSTGQRQRMKLAAALVHAPEMVFIDEPTNGLDPKGRRDMLGLIEELVRDRGMSVLLSTHILPDVEALCQSAIVLRDGLLVGIEDVRKERRVIRAGQPWFAVELLGEPEAFVAACKRAHLEVRPSRNGLQVQASTMQEVHRAADASGSILLRAGPLEDSVTDVLLDHLEGTPSVRPSAQPSAPTPRQKARVAFGGNA